VGCFSYVAVTLALVGALVSSPAAYAASGQDGEVLSEVALRRWPGPDAPVIRRVPAGSLVTVRGQWRIWSRVTGPVRGWIPSDQFRAHEGQTEGAPANADSPTPGTEPGDSAAGKKPRESSRDESDLMYSALKQWHGDTPESAAIDRAVAQSKRDASRHKMAIRERANSSSWKDPFVDEVRRPSPVRRARSGALLSSAEAKEESGQRGEVNRARAEAASARAEAAVARAEAAKAKADVARAEAVSARLEALAARRECVDVRLAGAPQKEKEPGRSGERAPRIPGRTAQIKRAAVVTRSRQSQSGPATTTPPAPVAGVEPAPPIDVAPTPPAGIGDAAGRGIIVVPITPPPAVRSPPPAKGSRPGRVGSASSR